MPAAGAATARPTLFFGADDGTHGTELWRTNGPPTSTRLVEDILPGAHGSLPAPLTEVGETLFFDAEKPYRDMDPLRELWLSDGTAGETRKLTNAGCTSGEGHGATFPSTPVGFNGLVFFTSCDREWDDVFEEWGRELWRSDGTRAGTQMVKDINPTGTAIPSDPVVLNGLLYFRAWDGVHGYELWRSDGTEGGTELVKDINPGDNDPGWYERGGIVLVGDQLFFLADDGVHGLALWRSDGTEAGTELVRDINPGPSGSPLSLFGIAYGGLLYFAADDGTHGQELWRSDGTDLGTTMVKDINPTGSSFPGSATYRGAERALPPQTFTVMGGVLYFTAADGKTGIELWRTDGTGPGTWQVANLNERPRPGSAGRDRSSNPAWLVPLHGDLLFAAKDSSSDIELWRSDGTPAGTRRVKNINRVDSSYPSALARFKGRVYFSAVTAGRGRELWRTDGTHDGTHLFQDIYPGPHSSSPYGFVSMLTLK